MDLQFGDAAALPELPGQGFAVLGTACTSPDSPLLPKPHLCSPWDLCELLTGICVLGPCRWSEISAAESPHPCGSAGNLGDNWLDSFSPDGWEVLVRMENNLSGVGILLAGAFWIKQSLCREVAEPQWPLQDLGLSSGLGTAWGQVSGSCGMGSAPPSCSLCCQNTGFGQLENRNSKAPLGLPGLRAVNVLCSGCGGLPALLGGLAGWILLRRRKKDGIVCEFGCQLLQLPWDGTAAVGGQLLRKCVLGKRELCAKVPGGAQTTAGSVFTFQQG